LKLKIKIKGKENRLIELNKELKAFEKEVGENLQSELGIYLRVQRSIQVEGTFGVIKEDLRYRRIKRRRLENVKTEIMLIAIGFNLLKYHRKRYREPITA